MVGALRSARVAFSCARSHLSFRFLWTFSNSGPSLAPISVPTRDRRRLYLSETDLLRDLDSSRISKKDSFVEDEYVSNDELKRKIEKFYEGDVESLPSIFEAILKRKLGGKSQEADEEIMKEIRSRLPEHVDDMDDEEFDSEVDELCKTDEELEEMCSVAGGRNAAQKVFEEMPSRKVA